MNIFATNHDPVVSARYLDTARQVKMTLESCQMLATSIHAVSGINTKAELGLSPTHANHPCNVWVRSSRHHWLWLLEHARAMADDHVLRTGNPRHATMERLDKLRIDRFARLFPLRPASVHANAARNKGLGVDFTWVPDVYKAYRLYLAARWQIQLELQVRGSRQKPVLCRFRPSPNE